jgi:hypothetical protein
MRGAGIHLGSQNANNEKDTVTIYEKNPIPTATTSGTYSGDPVNICLASGSLTTATIVAINIVSIIPEKPVILVA